jgi:mevalonate kinase
MAGTPLINSRSVCASAPGKAILFGEHAVVYGEPAVAAALDDLRIFVLLTPTSRNSTHASVIRVVMPDLPTPVDFALPVSLFTSMESTKTPPTPDDATVLAQLLRTADPTLDDFSVQALTPVLYLCNQILLEPLRSRSESNPSDDDGYELWVRSQDLPVGAGLGSSAAFGVACAAALIQYRQNLTATHVGAAAGTTTTNTPIQYGPPDSATLGEIDRYAYYSEILLHGTPSGIDNAVSAHGGVILFTKDVASTNGTVKMEHLTPPDDLTLSLVYTHVPRSTKTLVAGVRHFYQRHVGFVTLILEAMGAIARDFEQAIRDRTNAHHGDHASDSHDFGERVLTMVRTNQYLLQAVGVSHPSLDHVCAVVHEHFRDYGAAKLTGAGGGGCAFVLWKPGLAADVLATQRQRLQYALTTTLTPLSPYRYQCLASVVGGEGVLFLPAGDFPWDATTPSSAAPSRSATNVCRLVSALTVSALVATTWMVWRSIGTKAR